MIAMERIDQTLPSLAENLALDEALLLRAVERGDHGEAESGVLRFWSWPTLAVVVGAGGKLDEEIDRDACRADQIAIARRSSGGGTVLLGPGCLLYSLILPMTADPSLADLNASYRFLMGRLARALADVRDGIDWSGISDLVWQDRKISGNAQQRKRTHLLHHGTLLFDFDLSLIPRYLKHPPRMPEYRRGRPHREFVTNLPSDADRLKSILAKNWNATISNEPLPMEMVRRLVEEKYGRAEWTTRR